MSIFWGYVDIGYVFHLGNTAPQIFIGHPICHDGKCDIPDLLINIFMWGPSCDEYDDDDDDADSGDDVDNNEDLDDDDGHDVENDGDDAPH